MSDDAKGTVKVADDVIAVTAAMAAAKIRGVASLVGGMTDNITKNILRMNITKGVKVSRIEETALVIDIFVNIYYGFRIPEVAWEIQENVKREVKEMTGEAAKAVNIHVQGVELERAAAQDKGEDIS